MYSMNLFDSVDLYLGPGIYVGVGKATGLGIRFPVGVHAFVLDPLELFFELAPALGMQLTPSFHIPTFGIGGALGFRFWF